MLSKLNMDQVAQLRRLSQDGVGDPELAAKFGISLSTVQRYKFESARNRSREAQRNKPKKDTTCYRCGCPFKGHERCKVCTILIHSGLGLCEGCLAKQLH